MRASPWTGLGDAIRKKSATVLQIKKENAVHSFAEEECMAFADFINTKLGAHNPCPNRHPTPFINTKLGAHA